MPEISIIFAVLAAMCLVPSLNRGSLQDLKEFRFSERHFNSLWVNAACILLVITYIALIAEGNWFTVLLLIGGSLIFTLIFSFLGFRYGNGGDWRALIYISWIASAMIVEILISIGICGIAQAIYWMTRDDIPIPPMFRKVPFALSIYYGYIIGLSFFVMMIILG